MSFQALSRYAVTIAIYVRMTTAFAQYKDTWYGCGTQLFEVAVVLIKNLFSALSAEISHD